MIWCDKCDKMIFLDDDNPLMPLAEELLEVLYTVNDDDFEDYKMLVEIWA